MGAVGLPLTSATVMSFTVYGVGLAMLWTFVIGVLTWVNISAGRHDGLEGARVEARALFNDYLLYMQPAYMTREFHEIGRHRQHITSLKPRRPENAPDSWESAALNAFVAGAEEQSSVEAAAGGLILRYMAPVTIEHQCLQCHGDQGYKLGDRVGGIAVELPLQATLDAARGREVATVFGYGLLWFMGLCGLGLSVRSDRRRIATAGRAAEALRESEERYRALVEKSSEAHFIIDETGHHVDCNHAALNMVGIITREQLFQLTAADLSPERQPDGSLSSERANVMIELALARGVHHFEWMHRKVDGEAFPVEVSITAIPHHGRTLLHSIWRDITDRKRAEQEKAKLEAQLQQAQKMESVGRLAGGVAHDFNNMLGVILGYAEMAMEQVDATQPTHAALTEIHKAATRSAGLTRQLLAFARKQTIATKVLDLNGTVEGMLTLLRRLIGEDIDLQWQPAADLWLVKVDPSQVDQILTNLLVNARDAITGVGKITVEAENATLDQAYCADHVGFRPGDYVRLAVSDDGGGMGPEMLAQIFEPFFTAKAFGQGTGLGLATVYGIVKQNHGFITACSELERGTTVTIYLPRHVDNATQVQTDVSRDPAKRGHETILLVEDEPAILTLTTKMLERQGYTVLAACTPGEAMRLARAYDGKIHLLMTDVVMPEMNGRALAENVLVLYPGVKRLFMSGYTANVIAHDGHLEDGVHFVQKPFSIKDLVAKVREALDGKEGRVS